MSRVEKPRVLLVDDNEATCTLIAAILHRDYEIEMAGDGIEAIDKLKTKHYAAMLLDIRMPELDGYGVLDFLKETRPEMLRNVLIVTASLSEREMSRVRRYPVCGVVAKPFDVDALANAVRQCVSPGDKPFGGPFFRSSTMLLLLADLLRQRWM
jgi:putative two-component system response regulator